jgi:DNA-binding LytR/AlgR family response regulator
MSAPKILIVEDEALIADHIALCLEDLGYEVAGIADEGQAAIDLIGATLPDLCLLDINLSGGIDGVDVAHEVKRRHGIPFIFVTSNTSARMLDRVKVTEPAGFIVKPYTVDDLASNIAIALYKAKRIHLPSKQGAAEDSFFIREKHELIRLYFSEILYAEAMDNYTKLHTAKGRFVLSQTLKAVEQKLLDHSFVRVHRSFLVNLKHVDLIAPRHVLVGEMEVPLSETQRQVLLDHVQTW